MSMSVFFDRQFLSSRCRIAAALGAGVLLLGASACGSSSGDDAAPAGQGQQSSEGQPGQDSQGGPGGQGFPGASGEVVAVDGSTAQVQSRRGGQATGQTAVSWNGSTTFTQEVSGKLADVAVGSCVMVQSADTSGSSADSDTVTAGTVRIVSSSGEDCSMGGLGGGRPGRSGDQGSGQGGEIPSPPEGMPSGRPSGAPSGGIRVFGAFGKVTAVSSSGFTVESSLPGAPDGNDGGSAETSTVDVAVGSDTTYTKQAGAKAGDVKVGVCLQARGEADSTGTVTATTVSLSQPVDGGCGGFGMGGGMSGPGGPAGSAGGAGQES